MTPDQTAANAALDQAQAALLKAESDAATSETMMVAAQKFANVTLPASIAVQKANAASAYGAAIQDLNNKMLISQQAQVNVSNASLNVQAANSAALQTPVQEQP